MSMILIPMLTVRRISLPKKEKKNARERVTIGTNQTLNKVAYAGNIQVQIFSSYVKSKCF